jgi:hypothetical protein
MPGARLPDDPATTAPADWYSPAELAIFRLSSKSHWDLPLAIAGKTVHFLVSHPTPPVFDGPEDRNGTRNHDEVRFWLDYVTPGEGGYIHDDAGGEGGIGAGARFVMLGDLNLDPNDGDGMREIGATLLEHPLIRNPAPMSEGAVEDNANDGGFNANHAGDPAFDTADFGDGEFGPGNLRADYVLPSANLGLAGAGVFWPTAGDPLAALLGPGDAQTSDHRLVWIDVTLD